MDETRQPGLTIGQIFLVSASFQHREDYLSLPAGTKHKPGQLDVAITTKKGSSGDVAGIGIRVSTEPNDGDALYQFSVEMLAFVHQDADEGKNLSPVEFVTRMGVATLFPFVREAVANLTMRGRFGPVWLKPMNFNALLGESAPQTQE